MFFGFNLAPQNEWKLQNQANTCVSLRYNSKTELLQIIDTHGVAKTISVDTNPGLSGGSGSGDGLTSGQVIELINNNAPSYAGSDSISVNGNSISINTNFLEGYVASLGYVRPEDDKFCTADETSILLNIVNGSRVLSVSENWINGIISSYALKTDIPTVPSNVGAFTNDVGYLTAHQSLADYALKSEIPTNYLTAHQDLSNYALTSQIPTKTSDLTNDSHYLTAHQSLSAYVTKASINTITGNVSKLSTQVNINKNSINSIRETYFQKSLLSSYLSGMNGISGAPLISNSGYVFSIDENWLKGFNKNWVNDTSTSGGFNTVKSIANTEFLSSKISSISGSVNTISTNYVKKTQFNTLSTNVNTISTTYALKSEVPTKTSDLTNDSNFLTAHQSLEDYALKSEVPTGLDSWTSGVNKDYILNLGFRINDNNTTYGVVADGGLTLENEVDFAINTAWMDSKYAKLSSIPTNVSDLNNDKSFVTVADLESVKATLLEYLNPASVFTYINTLPEGGINDTSKNVFVATTGILSSDNTFRAKNISINELHYDTGRIGIYTDGDVTLKNISNSGTITKTSPSPAGVNPHSQIEIESAGRVVITDSTLTENGYNGIEIGQAKQAKSILIDNVTFDGTLTNNAINIYDTVPDAIVTINKCIFENVSNAIRLSNYSNISGLIINIVNCDFNKWEGDTTGGEYTGMILCQECKSADLTAVATDNRFSPNKIKINIINCRKNGNLITFSDPVDVCGSKDVNQLIYVYAQKKVDGVNIYSQFIDYDVKKYPKIACI